MRRLALAITLCLPCAAFAGPEGEYTVQGTSPGSATPYSGEVSVTRNGETYAVIWDVGGTKFYGTGLGASNVDGTFTMGPATPTDTAIAIGYLSGKSYGLAFYVLQANGDWQGIWAPGGAPQIGTEVWTPR